ncbi:MAG: pyrroline-5-carboxylate reductase [Kiritimatiellia bacterium]
MKSKTVFIGGGNMAEALLQGMLHSDEVEAATTVVTDVRYERLKELAAQFGVHTSTDNSQAVEGASTVWLCVKPQQMEAVLTPLKGLAPNALFVSIAAGIPTSRLEDWLGAETRVVRVMPNTPALVKSGAAGISAGSHAGSADIEQVERAMRCVGKTAVLPESDLHAVTALSGSGPAYVFYLIEAMLTAGEELNLPPEQARELAVQTVIGAGKLMEGSTDTAAELRARVTSKGGTTAAAIAAFDQAGVSAGLKQGILAAAARSRELAGE